MLVSTMTGGCAENHFDADMVEKAMTGSVRMLAEQVGASLAFSILR